MSERCNCETWARSLPIDLRGFPHHSACPRFHKTYYVEISLKDGGKYTQPIDDLGPLLTEIQEAAANGSESEWTVRLVEMSRLEYERLPEFTGH